MNWFSDLIDYSGVMLPFLLVFYLIGWIYERRLRNNKRVFFIHILIMCWVVYYSYNQGNHIDSNLIITAIVLGICVPLVSCNIYFFGRIFISPIITWCQKREELRKKKLEEEIAKRRSAPPPPNYNPIKLFWQSILLIILHVLFWLMVVYVLFKLGLFD